MLPWWTVGAALLAALAAAERARRLSKRLDRMREAYWDLRYELGQVQARVARLEGDPLDSARDKRSDQAPAGAQVQGANAFVPLSSLKR